MTSRAVHACRREVWLAARLLPVLASHRSLDALLRLATPKRPSPRYAGIEAREIVDIVKRAARRPWVMRDRRCLREGLLAFRFLRLAGFHPELQFSIAPSSLSESRPRAHCRVELDGETILNPCPEPMADLFSYDGGTISRDAGHLRASDITHA